MPRLGATLLLWAAGWAAPAFAAWPGQPAGGRGALGVLEDFAVGLAQEPLLLGTTLAGLLLLFLGGVGLGQRMAWLRPPTAQPSPSLARAAAALGAAAAPETRLDLRRARRALAAGRPLLLSLTYEVRGDRRGEYLAYMERLRDHLVRELGHAFAVWEQEGRPNWFTEMLLCTTPQEFDRLAGPDDTTTRRLLAGLHGFLRDPARVQRTALMGMAPAAMASLPAEAPAVRQPEPEAVPQRDARSVPIPRPAHEGAPGALPAEAA